MAQPKALMGGVRTASPPSTDRRALGDICLVTGVK